MNIINQHVFEGASGSGFCPEYQAIYDKLVAIGDTPDATHAAHQNAMVKSLADPGYWARMDLFYLLAQQNNANGGALINLVDPNAGTFDLVEIGSGSLIFTSDEGFTGDGVNYFNTNFKSNPDGVNITTNSSAFFVYIRTNVNEIKYDFGGSDAYVKVNFSANRDGQVIGTINHYTYNVIIGSSTDSRGFWCLTRTAIDASAIYKNGVLAASSTTEVQRELTADLHLFARGGALIASKQESIFIAMDGVTASEAASINTIIETYMDAIGKGVQP